MFAWIRRQPPREAPALPVVHDITQVQVLGLLITDTFRWKRDWAGWRVRFAYLNETPGQAFRDVAAFVREAAAALCAHRCEAAEIVLYLSHIDDLRAVFASYGMVPSGIGQISAIQSREAYVQAARLAADLAGITRVPDRVNADEALSLPDLTWSVEGYGMARIATTELRGRRITVRLGVLSGQEVWVVDVNDRPACARFRSRLDAMSKMGVAAAIKGYLNRPG